MQTILFNHGSSIPRSEGAQMDDRFNIRESAALLRSIFPNYPEMRGEKPTPDLAEFLREYRAADAGKKPQAANATG